MTFSNPRCTHDKITHDADGCTFTWDKHGATVRCGCLLTVCSHGVAAPSACPFCIPGGTVTK